MTSNIGSRSVSKSAAGTSGLGFHSEVPRDGKGWKGMERWNIEIRWKQDENIWNKVLDASSQSMSIPGGWLWHLCKGEGSSGWGVFAWTDKHKYTTERFMNFTKDHRGVTKSEQCERHIPNIALSLSFSHVILHLTFNCFRRWRVSSDQNSSTGCFLNRCFDKQLFALKKTSFSCFCPIHSGVMFRVRLDEVIVFRPLKEDDIRAIAEAVLTWKMQHFLYHFCNTKKTKSRKGEKFKKVCSERSTRKDFRCVIFFLRRWNSRKS